MNSPFRISLLVTALFSSALGARLQFAPEVVAFTHAAVVDPRGAATARDRTVVVTGDRISEIGMTGQVRLPRGARVVDASDKYLIPGSGTCTRTSSRTEATRSSHSTPPLA